MCLWGPKAYSENPLLEMQIVQISQVWGTPELYFSTKKRRESQSTPSGGKLLRKAPKGGQGPVNKLTCLVLCTRVNTVWKSDLKMCFCAVQVASPSGSRLLSNMTLATWLPRPTVCEADLAQEALWESFWVNHQGSKDLPQWQLESVVGLGMVCWGKVWKSF